MPLRLGPISRPVLPANACCLRCRRTIGSNGFKTGYVTTAISTAPMQCCCTTTDRRNMTQGRSPMGVIRYRGAWMPGIADRSPCTTDRRPISHRDFDHVLRPRRVRGFGFIATYEDRCPPKWTVVPSNCPAHAQWCAHNVKKWLSALPITADFSYRHFREINDNWKYDRSGRVTFDPTRHAIDQAAVANFARVRWEA